MSVPVEDVNDFIYNKVENDFSIDFLKNTLSVEISRLVIVQKNIVNILDNIIETFKEKTLNGG